MLVQVAALAVRHDEAQIAVGGGERLDVRHDMRMPEPGQHLRLPERGVQLCLAVKRHRDLLEDVRLAVPPVLDLMNLKLAMQKSRTQRVIGARRQGGQRVKVGALSAETHQP